MPTLEAPSGLVGEVRKIRGAELITLAEAAGDTSPDGGFSSVLSGCWVRTEDPGPYAFVLAGDTKPDWSRVLKGDALYAFIYLRQISLSDDYDFDVQCEECKRKYGWTIKLSDLPVRKLSEENAARLRRGDPFEAHVREKLVRFNLQTIAQEGPITKLMKQQRRQVSTMIDALAAQIVSIEGVKPDIKARHRFISDLDLDELHSLREALDAPDCGLETGIETVCTNRACQWTQDVNLPLGKSFFARRRRQPAQEPPEEEADTKSSSEDSSPGSTSSGLGASSITSFGRSTAEAATG